MAEALTFLAEEVGRAITLVWSAIGIAAKLNFEIMSFVLTVTSRMIHLLLLLMQKLVELYFVLTHDILLFLNDIGNGVMALIHAVQSIANSVYSTFGIIGMGISSSVNGMYSLVNLTHSCLINLCQFLVDFYYALKGGVLLLGSAVLFGVSFVPNLVCLLIAASIQLVAKFYLNAGFIIRDLWFTLKCTFKNISILLLDFFHNIPIHVLLGTGLGILILIGLKLLLQYMIDNFVLVPDLPVPSLVTIFRRRFLNWYVGVWRRANRLPTRENSTDEEFIDDVSDQNGNDNNANVHDRNLFQGSPDPSLITNAIISTDHDSYQPYPFEEELVNSFPHNLGTLSRPPISRKRTLGLKDNITEDKIKKVDSLNGEVYQEPYDMDRNIKQLDWAKQLYRELQYERENKLCIICQDKPKSVILLPCRHMCLCNSCRSAIITRDNSCPICRRSILDTLRVYL